MALDDINLSSLSGDELSALQFRIQHESIRRKAKEGRQQGLSFSRLKDIPSKDQHKHKFVRMSFGVSNPTQPIKKYRCAEPRCFAEAYHCPECKYVDGEPEEQEYDDIRILSGSKGVNYSCRICGTRLGTRVDMVS